MKIILHFSPSKNCDLHHYLFLRQKADPLWVGTKLFIGDKKVKAERKYFIYFFPIAIFSILFSLFKSLEWKIDCQDQSICYKRWRNVNLNQYYYNLQEGEVNPLEEMLCPWLQFSPIPFQKLNFLWWKGGNFDFWEPCHLAILYNLPVVYSGMYVLCFCLLLLLVNQLEWKKINYFMLIDLRKSKNHTSIANWPFLFIWLWVLVKELDLSVFTCSNHILKYYASSHSYFKYTVHFNKFKKKYGK